jgi:hypothetical protein
MISLTKYEEYIEIIILRSPEELDLDINYFKQYSSLIKINYNPETRMLSIKIDNTIHDRIFGEIIRIIIRKEEKLTFLTGRSYYNSIVRRRFPKQNT